jgi:hypothetical protein
MTRLMAAFIARLSVTEPKLASFLPSGVSKKSLKKLATIDRPQFLEQFLLGN